MQAQFKKIADEKDLRGKKVLLRLDLNVPVVGEEIRDDFRIKKSLPVLEMLRERGARTIIISHIDSPSTDSLGNVGSYLCKSLGLKAFIKNLEEAQKVVNLMDDGETVLLENLRKDPGEKGNDPVFAARLAHLADIYVNDAFSASHREHASIVSIPRLMPSFAGPLLTKEVEELSKAFNPQRPFLFILGGAKFDTKLPLIEKFLGIADYVFVGGALANDLFREKGYEIGQSIVSSTTINLKHIEQDPKLILPSDVTTVGPMSRTYKSAQNVAPDEKIMDAGVKSVSELADLLNEARLVVWNGPLGDYEKGFSEGTEGLAKAIIESGAVSMIGGGDTIAVVDKMGILDRFSFVSTGGGAMIEFLAKGTLPGIEALSKK